MRLAIVTTHPIQYYAPVFKLLSQKTDLKVFYTWGETLAAKHDPGFGQDIIWDIDLLDGYNYEWINNTATDPGSHHYKGIINPDLIDKIKLWQPDTILVYGWAYKSHLKVMRYFRNKIPVFFRGDSTLLDNTGLIKKLIRGLILRWVYSFVDHAFYVGTNNKAYFKNYGLKDSQLTFAPHAVDNARFAASRLQEVQLFKQKLNIPADDLLILFAGKFEDKKDPMLLINAFLQLQQPQVHLLFVGNGKLEKDLKAVATVSNTVHFISFVNQSYMPVIYQACDLFCLPSKGPGETWGLAVNEAMACAKAILVSDKTGSAIDLVSDDYNGQIFKSESMPDLILSLKKLTASKKLLKTYGQNSAEKIKTWDFETAAQIIANKLNT